MTTPGETTTIRTSTVRLIAGAIAAIAALLFLIGFGWGVWNPQRYVVLLTYFSNPFADAFALAASFAVAVWLLLPVRNEAVQFRRNNARWVALVVAIVTMLCFLGEYGMDIYNYRGTVLSRSTDGTLALALVDRGRYGLDVRVWSGRGVTTRDLGGFGKVCGAPVRARFAAPGEVFISTNYGDFHMRVDQRGRPLTHKGRTCSD